MVDRPNFRLPVDWRRHPDGVLGTARDSVLALLRWVRHYVRGFYAVAGLFLSLGLVLALAGLWALGGLAESVMEGETLRFDEAVLRWINAHATEWLDVTALKITAVGDTLVVLVIAVVASLLLWLLQRRSYSLLILAAVLGAWAINPVLKLTFDRPRPQVFEWRAHYVSLPSFPSGHATMSMVLFVALAYVMHRLVPRQWISVLVVAASGILVTAIGLSRLYLGVHYPSDVIAGYVVGFSWAIFCSLGVEALWRLRRLEPGSERETLNERERENETMTGDRRTPK